MRGGRGGADPSPHVPRLLTWTRRSRSAWDAVSDLARRRETARDGLVERQCPHLRCPRASPLAGLAAPAVPRACAQRPLTAPIIRPLRAAQLSAPMPPRGPGPVSDATALFPEGHGATDAPSGLAP